jgi:simple sugar transport system substrate-binding protein
MKRFRWLALVLAVMLVAGACGDSDDDGATEGGTEGTAAGGTEGTAGGGTTEDTVDLSQGGDVTIEVVTHGQASDPFWSVVKNGVDAAAAAMGVTANYSAPATFDMVEMASLIDAAVAAEPDGLVVSLPDPDALGPSIQAAVEAGIPVITINSGVDAYAELGAMTHVGQTEFIAGEGGGRLLAEAGATNVLCVNQEVGNTALDQRCDGAASSIEEAGGTLEVLQVDLNDATEAQNLVASALQADDTIDGVLALGPTGALPALAAVEDVGKLGEMHLGTFDLSPEVLDAIEAGDMLFAIDQQQYLQGYLPIVFLTLNAQNLNTVGGGLPILTGPGFVTVDNAGAVKELSAAGTR